MFDKLDALFLLLPELEVAVDRGGDYEVGPGGRVDGLAER